MERDCQHGLYKAGMGSSRVLSDFAEKYGSKNRVLAGFGIGGKSGKEKEHCSTHFRSHSTKKLRMEEMVNKLIKDGKREHDEMEAFIGEFRTTNELLFKERNNSLRELEFEVYGLSRAINKA
ncbi:hypothetical protein Tco_0647089 [Tanacetum coccineum]